MKKGLFVLAIVFICSACLVQKDNKGFRTITLINYEHKNDVEIKVKYFMGVPKSGYKDKLIISGMHVTENRVLYQDSSIIYMSNDNAGSALNYENIQKISDKQQTGKLFVDTLSLEGQTENENFWKEVKLGEICIGYVNVPPDRKKLYDKALSTIKGK